MKRIFRVSVGLLIVASTLSAITVQNVNAVSANPTPDCSAGTTCTITFSYTGDYYTWTVPSGNTSLTIDAQGAQGGNNRSTSVGGKGGRVQATLSVTSGQTLHIYVGGQGTQANTTSNAGTGGWNGGGKGGIGYNTWSGSGGGGASDIRTSVGVLSSRLIVAGGGGGAACNACGTPTDDGAVGGGLTGGTSPGTASGSTATTGGTQSAGGTGNQWSGWAASTNGTLGVGGDGHLDGASSPGAGGGGGGGYYGGGGGSWVGGGGGSSFTHATLATSVTNTQGQRSGSGVVIITYLNSPQPTTFRTLQASPANISSATTISYSLILSQSVSDLAAGDFQLGGTSTCNSPTLTGSGTTYTVTLTNCSEGSVILQLKANSITGTSAGPPAVTSANSVVIDRTAPTISSVTAPLPNTYRPSETPTFTVNFSESVTVTGTPRLTLSVGTSTKYANFLSLTDSRTALFRYTIATASDEWDADGISVLTNLDLNSGTIADLATNALGSTSFSAPTLSNVKVAQPPAAPTIDSISVSSGTFNLYFTAGSDRGWGLNTYQYSTDNGATWRNRTTGTTASPILITQISASSTNLTNGVGYPVRIRAVNGAGGGDSSTVVTETPTSIVVTGDATLNLSYGSSASTGTYSATGGTNTYTWSLGTSISGVTLSGTTVTAGNTLAAGTYTQTVRATDGNSLVGSKTLTITINKASTSITIALPGSATNAALGGAVTITANVPRAGSVNFMLGGSTISGCGSAAAASTSATCSWTPGALGSVSLTATYTPTDASNYETSTTTTLSITVVNGVSNVTLSLAGGAIEVPKGQTINIIATIDQAGKVSFFVDGKRIPGCFNRTYSAGNATCAWKPATQNRVSIRATLNPTNSVYNNASSMLNVWVKKRAGLR